MKMLTLLILGMLCVPLTPDGSGQVPDVKEFTPEKTVSLTIEEKIVLVLIDSGITDVRMQKIMLAQAKFESRNFKNKLAIEHNNVFSLHHSKNDTLSLGKLGRAEGCACFASYRSVEDATRAYLRLIHRMQIPRDPDVRLFTQKLKKAGYYTSSRLLYERGLNYWIDSMKDSTFFNQLNPNSYGSTASFSSQQGELLED
jgi:hypothetical protein